MGSYSIFLYSRFTNIHLSICYKSKTEYHVLSLLWHNLMITKIICFSACCFETTICQAILYFQFLWKLLPFQSQKQLYIHKCLSVCSFIHSAVSQLFPILTCYWWGFQHTFCPGSPHDWLFVSEQSMEIVHTQLLGPQVFFSEQHYWHVAINRSLGSCQCQK